MSPPFESEHALITLNNIILQGDTMPASSSRPQEKDSCCSLALGSLVLDPKPHSGSTIPPPLLRPWSESVERPWDYTKEPG